MLAIIIYIIVVTIVTALSTHFLTVVPSFISVLHSMGDMETQSMCKILLKS